MDTVLIIANILSFIGNGLFTLSALLKSKRKILLFQSANHILAIISEYMTKAYTGLVQEAVCLVRNILFLFINFKRKLTKNIISVILALIAAILGIVLNNTLSDNVWYGYLPVICGFEYSMAVMIAFTLNTSEVNSEIIIKISLFINSIGWSMYGFFVELYPIFFFNILNGVFCIISLVRAIVIKKKEISVKEENKEI